MNRILHVVTTMNRGGLETVIMNYYRELDRASFQFDFLMHRKERSFYDDEIESMGGRIFRFDPLTPARIPGYLKELENFFVLHPEYDIIHSHLDTLSTFPLMAAKKARKKIRIAHSHSASITRDKKACFRIMSRALLPLYATHKVACSEKAGLWLHGNAFKSSGFIIRNAISFEQFRFSSSVRQSKRAELGLENHYVVGHVGNFTQPKNQIYLLDVMKEIILQNENSVLVSAGDGELLQRCMARADELDIRDRVLFLGSREDVADLYQAFDVLVFPSVTEGLGMTVVEAQASGLPCFVSDAVPSECQITDLVTFIPLKNAPAEWAREILRDKITESKRKSHTLSQSGYDVSEEIHVLQHWYQSLLSGF